MRTFHHVGAALLLALALGAAGCGDDDDDERRDAGDRAGTPAAGAAAASASSAAGPAESDLFVLTGTSGSMRRTDDGLRLTLRAPGRSVLRFSDRPVREADRLTARDLVDRWDDLGFAQDPPNAALDVAGAGGDDVLAVTLSDPRRSGDDVTFRAIALPGGGAELRRTRRFGAASLFIDPSGSTTSDAGTPGCGTTGELVLFAGRRSVPERLVVGNAVYRKTDWPKLADVVGDRFGDAPDSSAFVTPGLQPIDGDAARNASQDDPDDRPVEEATRIFADVCADGAPASPPPADPAAVVDGPGGCTVGEVRYTGLADEHAGWMRADGRSLAAEDYPLLAATIGTRFGGDAKTVKLPKADVPAIARAVAPNAQICVTGVPPSEAAPCTLGTIGLYAGSELPPSVGPARGDTVLIRQLSALYSLLGNDFGGNMATTFQLPSLAPRADGLQWGICLSGTFPQRSDLDPTPAAGVQPLLTPIAPCNGTLSGTALTLQLRFTGPTSPPYEGTRLGAFGISGVRDSCSPRARTVTFSSPEGSLRVSRFNDPVPRLNGVLQAGPADAQDRLEAQLSFFDGSETTGSFTLRDPGLRLCDTFAADGTDCTDAEDETETYFGTFLLTPRIDDFGLRPLLGFGSTP